MNVISIWQPQQKCILQGSIYNDNDLSNFLESILYVSQHNHFQNLKHGYIRELSYMYL